MPEDNLNTPAPGPEITDEANNDFVDVSIDSWLTIDLIGTNPAVENVCPIENRRPFWKNLKYCNNYPQLILIGY